MPEIEYSPTRESWAAFLRHELAAEPLIRVAEHRLLRAAWARTVLLLPVIVAISWGLLAVVNPDNTRLSILLGGLLWVLFAMYALQKGRSALAISRRLREIESSPSTTTTAQRYKVSLSETGVTVAEPLRSSTLAWPLYARVVYLPECVVIESAQLFSSVVIPTSQFSSELASVDFAAQAQALHDASGSGERAQLRARLDAHDLACPDCRYRLRGLNDPRCPECGRVITVTTLRCMDVLRCPSWTLIIRGHPK